MKLSAFLGEPIWTLLRQKPFDTWEIVRSTDDACAPPCVDYVFVGQGVSVVCDADETITTIFIETGNRAASDGLPLDHLFHWGRSRVLGHFGPPSRSGGGRHDSMLGLLGAWDRFEGSDYTTHLEYEVALDRVKRVTLMRPDVVPRLG
ncbi:hypothetical protein [Ancylobacter terrae]|uniref:hypothetical protein n=1 Tax=Ancylobacter sp. sgz301288 TaxID=3342077 RepID=UPI003858F2A7